MSQDLSEIRLTRAVVRQQVARQAALSPLSAGTTLAGLLLSAGGLFSQLSPILALTGAVLIPAGFLINYRLRYAEYSKNFVRAVDDAIDRNRRRREGEIRADLYDLASGLPATDASGDLAARALAQFARIHDKYELFLEVLDRKLHIGELAYARFHASANDFFVKVMEHLGRTGDALKLASQSESEEVCNRHLASVTRMLDQNQEALEAFDRASESIAGLVDKDANESEDVAFITSQLDELARQAKRLANV